MAEREHDIVVFGATGFTGALTAEYLAGRAGDGLRWALAGRNQQKLEQVRDHLEEVNPPAAELPLLHADIDDHQSIHSVADSTKVVVTTVVPYIHYGESLMAPCAAPGP